MNKNEHLNRAQEFSGEKDAYIHCEIKNGETRLVVGGQMFGIIYGAYRALKRTSELTGCPVSEMIGLIEEFYDKEINGDFPFDDKEA